ncbi:MAG: hypothetical protein M1140_08800 [Chloroflexi bacterium]|nr:hypothetical protein [Chloroflexota bacterium]
MAVFTRDDLIDAARSACARAQGPLSRRDFVRITGISEYHIDRLFPEGRWSELKRLAGIDRHPKDNQPLTDDDLLQEFHSVASRLGRIPTWALFAHNANISADVVRRRFGGLQGTLKQYCLWLEAHHPDTPLLAELHDQSRHQVPPPPQSSALDLPDHTAPSGSWAKVAGSEYGPPISFRGLRHAPINEQGVVFLFGMVSYEIGFIVEAVHASFPDCEAKRCIDVTNQRWQRVRIEFEYRSRTFRDHGHDPSACDLIVCWEHNWLECPLEVVELRRILDELEG